MFIDGGALLDDPSALERRPLGGSQSAMLLVAAELARRGMEVGVTSPRFPGEAQVDGVRCVRWDPERASAILDADVVVSQNGLLAPEFADRHLAPGRRYVHWHQNDTRSPYGRVFGNGRDWRRVDRFVFVSHRQAGDFASTFGLPSSRLRVIGNPVAEDFLSVFPEGAPILAGKDPELLVYASAPNRGLEGLLKFVLPALRKTRPGLRLEIYSGFHMDQGLGYRDVEGRDTVARQEAWLAGAQATPGVTLNRGVPKAELARRFGRAAMLCYPCTFRETFCLVAREAMATGCLVATSTAGALPETTAGFAVLVAAKPTATQFVELEAGAFARAVLAALDARDRNPEATERRLARQIRYVRENSAPAVIGGLWQDLLASLR